MKILNHREDYNPYGLTMDWGTPYTREETKAFFRAIEITDEELGDLNEWVKDGNVFYNNPWLIYTDKGNVSNFVDASRFVTQMYEDHLQELLVPPTPITDTAFLYEDDELPF